MATALSISQDVTQNRHLYLGGSDISVVMGLNRYKTPLQLWLEKTQRVQPKDLSNVESVYFGNKLEQFVANEFSVRTGKDVRRAPKFYQHPKYPYMVAHIDRLITGEDALLECKTTSAFNKSEWETEEIPQEYILQVMWYLGITGRKVGWIAVLIGGQSFKYKQINFDAELFDKMVEKAKEFWEHVTNDTPVDIVANDDETFKELYSKDNEVMIDLFPIDNTSQQACNTFEETVALYQENKMHISNIEKENKLLKAKIEDLIKDNLGIQTPKYIVTWNTITKTSLDTTRLKEERPETVEDYKMTSQYRMLKIKKNKEA